MWKYQKWVEQFPVNIISIIFKAKTTRKPTLRIDTSCLGSSCWLLRITNLPAKFDDIRPMHSPVIDLGDKLYCGLSMLPPMRGYHITSWRTFIPVELKLLGDNSDKGFCHYVLLVINIVPKWNDDNFPSSSSTKNLKIAFLFAHM